MSRSKSGSPPSVPPPLTFVRWNPRLFSRGMQIPAAAKS